MSLKIPSKTSQLPSVNSPQHNTPLEDQNSGAPSVSTDLQLSHEEDDDAFGRTGEVAAARLSLTMGKMLRESVEEVDDENTPGELKTSFELGGIQESLRTFSTINPRHEEGTDEFPSQLAPTLKKFPKNPLDIRSKEKGSAKHVSSANVEGFLGTPSVKKSGLGSKRIHHRKSKDDSSKKKEGISQAPSFRSIKAPKGLSLPSISEDDGSPQPAKNRKEKGLRKSRHHSLEGFGGLTDSAKKHSKKTPAFDSKAFILEEEEPALDFKVHKEIMLTKESLRAATLELQKKYLDESDPQTDFVDRTGAFGYHEIYNVSLHVVEKFKANVKSPSLDQLQEDDVDDIEERVIYREKTLSPEMRGFFVTNLQFLQNELFLQNEKLGPQIDNFNEILGDFAQLRQEQDAGKTVDPARLASIKQRLRKLEFELRTTAAVIQENKLVFQPLAFICQRVESGEIKGLSLRDLDGKLTVTIPSSKKPSRHLLKECQLAGQLYNAYADSILDPHFFYCSKFLTAITKFKFEELNSLNESAQTHVESRIRV